jgi:hypothetical protein
VINTTLNLLKENNACKGGYESLLNHVGIDFDKDKPIPLTTILESNNLNDTLWVLDNAPLEVEGAKILRFYFSAWCARQVLPIYEKEYPNDSRVSDCINTVEAFAKGEATQEDLADARDAAWDATAAAWDAAWAARDAAWDAARDATAAARAAAKAAAWDARDAATAAAKAAAWDATAAARDAAWDATAAARDAAWDAATAAQEKKLVELLNNPHPSQNERTEG